MSTLELLEGVKSLGNSNNITTLEITTNKNKYKFRLPYSIVTSDNNHIEFNNKYNYSISIVDYCKIHNIEYRYYFNILHKDCLK